MELVTQRLITLLMLVTTTPFIQYKQTLTMFQRLLLAITSVEEYPLQVLYMLLTELVEDYTEMLAQIL